MNLRDKLKLYERRGDDAGKQDFAAALLALGGEKIPSGGKEIWRFTARYPLSSMNITPADTQCAGALEAFYRFNRLSIAAGFSDMVFLDLETTSLSTGTGNYAFLAGIGRLEGGDFVVEQLFMHDYSVEGTILRHMLPRFQEAGAVVTYNGKTFDIPLLKNRYRINRVPGYPMGLAVIDLIHPCRRLFKKIYESCSLKSIEENLLGVYRHDDIPGWLIPEVFFSFQKHGETDRLGPVLEHNRLDIKALFILLYSLAGIYRRLGERDLTGFDAKLLINLAHSVFGSDLELFIEIVKSLEPCALHDRILFKKYSAALKRSARIEEAKAFWKSDGSIFSLEELAKYAEHREKNFRLALEYCARAVELIGESIFSPRREAMDADRSRFFGDRFAYRMNRLVRRDQGR
jgi:uncharacterized protein YprB with RNaseH-like and TPR domain